MGWTQYVLARGAGAAARSLPSNSQRLCALALDWLGGRDSNPDTQIQSLQSYH